MPDKKGTPRRRKRKRVQDEDDFWEARPLLQELRQFARARMVSPWAMFGVVAARAVTTAPPYVTLPPTVATNASLNLFIALVGDSSGGKSGSMSAARDFIGMTPEPFARPLGSGEGLVKQFARRDKGTQINEHWSVLCTVPEVDTLTALGARQGATLLPQLRSAWSGEKLGHSYADSTKGAVIEDHRYRLCLLLGVQPLRAGPLVDDAEGGTPQRFLWAPTSDVDAPDSPPEAPTRRTLSPWSSLTGSPIVAGADDPITAELDTPIRSELLHDIAEPPEVVEFVKANRQRELRMEPDALPSHSVLNRLKLAAALMVLDERTDKISIEDWDLAGVAMAISDRTREQVVTALAEKAHEQNKAQGRAAGTRNIAASDVASEDASVRRRVSVNLVRYLGEGEQSTRDLTKRVKLRERYCITAVLEVLVGSGEIVERQAGKNSFKYSLPEPE